MSETELLFIAIYSVLIITNFLIMVKVGSIFKKMERVIGFSDLINKQYLDVIAKTMPELTKPKEPEKKDIPFTLKVFSEDYQAYYYEDVIKYLGGSESKAAAEFRKYISQTGISAEFFNNRTVIGKTVVDDFLSHE